MHTTRSLLRSPAVRLLILMALIVGSAYVTAPLAFQQARSTVSQEELPSVAAVDLTAAGNSSMTQAGTAIEGWVVDQASGAPVEGASVVLHTNTGSHETTPGADGYFAFDTSVVALPRDGASANPELVSVTISAQGHAAWSISEARYYAGDTLRLYPKLTPGTAGATEYTAAGVHTSDWIAQVAGGLSMAPEEQGSGPSIMESGDLGILAAPSNLAPPGQIRVYRTSTGVVEVVPFKDYVKHVLPNEWIPTWHPNSLRAGAMAVKEYAWYWVSLGGKQTGLGADVKDNTDDQVYDPNVSYASTDAAVDATWAHAMTRGGALFQAQYCAGSYGPNPTGDCPWGGPYMTQWGSAYYADQGKSWGWILQFYYRGAVVTPSAPGSVNDPVPPAPPTAAPPPPPTTFTVGQGATRPDLFQQAYERNGGEAVLGRPTGAAKWWMPYVSENNVIAQPFSGPTGDGKVWLVFDVLKSEVGGVNRAYMISGPIASAYAGNNPVGPEWVGAPTSDPYTAAAGAGGALSQGFSKGTLYYDGNKVQLKPWPSQFSGWKAEYYAGNPTSPAGKGPLFDLSGRPALVSDLPTPDMNWPLEAAMPKSMGLGTGEWAAQFTRQLDVEKGSYDLVVTANSGVRLWVDNLLAVNAWDAASPHTQTYNVDLDAGSHSIRIQFYSPNSAANLQFTMSHRGGAKTAAPVEQNVQPDTAALRVKVRWLGRAASPSDTWVQPLALQLSVPGDPQVVYTAQGTTDHNGVIIYSNLPVGTFDVHVKGTHSLQSARAGVSLTANRTADVDMKAIVEGDVDGDNCVTVSDFAVVQGMIGAHKDIPGFNALADLNGDGEVTPADVSLLRSGFDMCGDISADNQVFALSTENAPSLGQTLAPWLNPGALRRDLALSLVPSTASPRTGEVLTVLVIGEASTQPIDGASFILNYDPSRLLAVDAQGNPAAFVEPGADLPSVYTNWVDAKGGAVGYAAGMLQGAAPQGRLVLATLRFKALVPGATELRFGAMPSGHMQLTNGGINLLSVAKSAILTVNP